MRGTLTTRIALAVLAVLMLVGLAALLRARFERGDIYPPYSSLRSDPLGTRVLVESLDRLPGVRVQRLFRPLSRLDMDPKATLCYFGMSPEFAVLPREMRELQQFVHRGGRLVVALKGDGGAPVPASGGRRREDGRNQAEENDGAGTDSSGARDSGDSTGNENGKDDEVEEEKHSDESTVMVRDGWPVPALARWGVTASSLPGSRGTIDTVALVDAPGAGLPATLSWRSGLVFSEWAPEWDVVYARQGDVSKAVLLRRMHGAGEMILSTDSYLLSNEAMRNDRQPEFLLWLSGDRPLVAVDETHFGLQEGTGVVALARRYGLTPLALAILGLCILFVWRQALAWMPSTAGGSAAEVDEVKTAKTSFSGFVALVRRSVPRSKLIETCVATWQETVLPSEKDASELRGEMDRIVERCRMQRLSPHETYGQLRNQLKERIRPWTRTPHT